MGRFKAHQIFIGLPCEVQRVKNLPAKQETRVWSLDQEDLQGEGMAMHSSILAWRIPWTEEPHGLWSIGSQKAGHGWSNLAHLYIVGNYVQCYMATWMGEEFGGEWIHVYVWLSPFPVHLKLSQYPCLENSMDRGAWQATIREVGKNQTWLSN